MIITIDTVTGTVETFGEQRDIDLVTARQVLNIFILHSRGGRAKELSNPTISLATENKILKDQINKMLEYIGAQRSSIQRQI